MKASEQDIKCLESLYAGTKAYQGELHDHGATGGTSDGHNTLDEWKEELAALEMDFATIVDHRQVRHMYLPEWDKSIFIGGTEPGTRIEDGKGENNALHYNMLFADPEPLEELLEDFTEYEFTGGPEGHFIYPRFTRERFCHLVNRVFDKGGFFVHPHPTSVMISDDPLDYWFRDGMGLEVFYTYHDEPGGERSQANYQLWRQVLALGKRVYATAGNDEHRLPKDKALTTIYARKKDSHAFIAQLRAGNITCGGVGVRMCVGDTKMGGSCSFAGKRLVLSVGDFHRSLRHPDHTYRVVLLSDEGEALSREIRCDETTYFALDADDTKKFYRAEIYDNTQDFPIALGNPIWNEQ